MVRFLTNPLQNLALSAFLLLPTTSAVAGLFCEWVIDPQRPYCSPEYQQNWGVHVTSWKQFPMHSQYGDYCPDCQAGGSVSGAPVQTLSGVPTSPGVVNSPSAIIIPQQHQAGTPMVFPPPNVSPGTMYNSNPVQPQPAPMQMFPQAAPGSMSQGGMVPLPTDTMPPAPTPMESQLLPQPANPPAMQPTAPMMQPTNPPIPQPNNGASGPIPLPDFPAQTGIQGHTNSRFSSFAGQRPPLVNGSFQQRVAPVPVYQQPSTIGAVPLIRNTTTTDPQRVPVTGVSFTQPLPPVQPQAPKANRGLGRFLKMPNLPFFGK